MHLESNGQTSVEYLLILGGAIAIVVTVTALGLNMLGTNQSSVNVTWNPFEGYWQHVNITSPTTNSPNKTGTISVTFEITENIQDYNLGINSGGSGCTLLNNGPESLSSGTTKKAVTKTLSLCSLGAGQYDLNVSVRYSALRSEMDIEKKAITR